MIRWWLLMVFLLASCEADRTAGTGSQTGNSVVAGRLLRADSLPAKGVEVSLTPASWGSPRALTQWTDSLGRYRFEAVDAGLWTLQIPWPALGDGAHPSRAIPVAIPSCRPCWPCPEGWWWWRSIWTTPCEPGRLLVMGTDDARSLASADREMFVRFTNLAPGVHWFSIVGPDGKILRAASLTARSGRTDTLLYTQWRREIKEASEDGELEYEDEEDEED
jgi:hypothetical protein